ncbi:MAG: ACT domain-containing protein, partial [Eubacterium sp.]|nr:ACT domain-containing protein [Eubacterium sp.]
MAITQLSAFLENTPGTLCETVAAITKAGVNIRALSVADTKDFGILRIIVSDIDKT